MIDAERIRTVFEEIHRRSFVLDGASNRRLAVEVLDAGIAHDTPVFVLITPWTLNGLAFTPDGRLPDAVVISARRFRVFPIEIPELGAHHSVNLVPDVSQLPSLQHARKTARAMAEPFRAAIAQARMQLDVPDASRRALLRRPVAALKGEAR